MSEHAVLLEWDREPSLEFLFDAEDRLTEIIASPTGLGEVDGNDVGGGTATIYIYGPDCDALWAAIEATVRELDPAPARVTIRPGGPETPGRALVL